MHVDILPLTLNRISLTSGGGKEHSPPPVANSSLDYVWGIHVHWSLLTCHKYTL